MVLGPSANGPSTCGLTQAVAPPPSNSQVNVTAPGPASVAVKLTVIPFDGVAPPGGIAVPAPSTVESIVTTGGVASTVQLTLAVVAFPTPSVAVTSNVRRPSARPPSPCGLAHPGCGTPSNWQVTLSGPASAAVKPTVIASVGVAPPGEIAVPAPSIVESIVTTGGVVSTVQLTFAVLEFPTPSVAVTANVCSPSPRPASPCGLAHPGCGTPSNWQVTLSGPASVAVNPTVIASVGVAPPGGIAVPLPSIVESIVTTGGVPSTVQLTLAESAWPTSSVVVTCNVCSPSASEPSTSGLTHPGSPAPSSWQVKLIVPPPVAEKLTVRASDAVAPPPGTAVLFPSMTESIDAVGGTVHPVAST